MSRLTLAAVLLAGAAAATHAADGAVATVDDETILESDVAAFIAGLPPEAAATPLEDLWAPVVARMINDRLVIGEARERGYHTGEAFAAELARLEEELLRQTYYRILVARAVPDERVREAWDAWSASRAEELRASHVLVATRGEALAVAESARAGADFAELAMAHSTGPSAPRGGDLGWFGPGVMVPEFDAAARALAPGEVSEPVETAFGWHVIRLEARRVPEARPFAEMAGELKEQLVLQAIAQDLERLRSSADIEIVQPAPPQGFGREP